MTQTVTQIMRVMQDLLDNKHSLLTWNDALWTQMRRLLKALKPAKRPASGSILDHLASADRQAMMMLHRNGTDIAAWLGDMQAWPELKLSLS